MSKEKVWNIEYVLELENILEYMYIKKNCCYIWRIL